jgi:hypothetical protein
MPTWHQQQQQQRQHNAAAAAVAAVSVASKTDYTAKHWGKEMQHAAAALSQGIPKLMLCPAIKETPLVPSN